jgi:tetratricopeptide (TPR) repeat protein
MTHTACHTTPAWLRCSVSLACLGLISSVMAQPKPQPAAPAPAPTPAASASTPAVRALIDQARHWQQNGRTDLATQSWQKLLGVDPRQPDALQGLAQLSIEAGKFEEASAYLARLKQVQPDRPGLDRLNQQVQNRTSSQSLIATARQYAKAGQTAAAARTYSEAFGQQPPSDDLAMEYYQTLGGTPAGWDEARRGLEHLVQAQPDAPGPALAYAEHLSYREPSRRDAIKRLASLAVRTDIPTHTQQAARTAWRQALLWLDARPADAPLFQHYLSSVGDDLDVRARIPDPKRSAAAAARPLSPYELGLKNAYAALNAGDTAQAEERFTTLLHQQPANADALAGLGIVRLRQNRFSEASDLLDRASTKPAGARWKPLLQTAQHWQALQDSQAARQSGDLERATQLARRAVESDAKEPEAQTLLGDLLAEQAQVERAEAAYRAALQQQPEHPRATLGLINLLGTSGRTDEARELAQKLDPAQLARVGGPAGLRANQLQLLAAQAEKRGDLAGAQALLEQALSLAPASPWARLSLGQVLVRQGRLDAARAQVDAFVIPISDSGEALQARMLLQSELQDWTGALQSLEQIPRQQRNADMARQQRRLAVRAQVAQATALGRSGQGARAQLLLQEAEQEAGTDLDLIGVVADGYLALDDDARASQLIRATLASQPQAGVSLRLRHGALLLRARQDAELTDLLRQLASQPLNTAQRHDFEALRLGLSLRQSDQLREQGDLANAWEAIAPLLREQPQEPRLQMALARMHSAANDHAQARSLYETVLEKRPDDVDAWLGLAGSADAQKDHDSATQALDEARRLAPDSPLVLAQLGRHYRAMGQYSKAAEYLRAAIAAEQPGTRGWGTEGRASRNPFAGRSGNTRPASFGTGSGLPRSPFAPVGGHNDQPLVAVVTALPDNGSGPVQTTLSDSPIARSRLWLDPAAAPKVLVARATPVAAPPAVTPATPPLPFARRSKTLAHELDELQSQRDRTHVEFDGSIRSRSGESGLSRLDMVQTPVEGRFAVEQVGLLTLRATPVLLDAGQLGTSVDTRARSGSLVFDTTRSVATTSQSAAGIGLGIGLKTRAVTADLGTTPLGFEVVDVVGGVKYQDQFGDGLNLALEASRRAITDSLLSFAGTPDARTGRVWGGVRSTGGRAQLGWEQDDVGLYGYGTAHLLTGQNVADNQQLEAGIGSYWHTRRHADEQFELGLNLSYQHYQKNLRGFTWGHGGYFSPQQMISLSVPTQWSGRQGRLNWGVQGSVSMQAYQEDAAPYFPTDPAAQSTLETMVSLGRATAASYAQRSSIGMGLNLGGVLEFQLTRQVDLGTRISLEHAPQFNQGGGSVYLRFNLEPRGTSATGLQVPSAPMGY